MSGTLKVGGKTLATHDTAENEISFHSDVMATTAQVQGTHTTFSGSHSDTATTINLASVSGISSGDYVVGEGIATGTTVSSVGASSVVISAGLDTDGVGIAGGEPISFYKSTKALSPGLVAGGLCRAWARIQANGTIIGSHNVSSVSASVGAYTVNFSNAMPDTNYSVCLSLGDEQTGRYDHYLHTANTGSVLIKVMYEGGNFGSFTRSFSMAIFR